MTENTNPIKWIFVGIILSVIGFSIWSILPQSSNISPNKTHLSNSDLINGFCKSEGFDYGFSEQNNPYDYWQYRQKQFGWGQEPTGIGNIMCIKNTVSSDYYSYADFYRYILKV